MLPFSYDQNPNPNPNLITAAAAAPLKKKRNLPGTPDPDAEVIALSPKTLMATNRFVCEICNKGFQRDQNLQLHRRGHNLPWKLRQRSPGGSPARKRVYVCPEPTCVHHDPARALGDLTGIKKHFSRKHGEKKWKCDRCGKRYAVNSDYKAHSKTCGTREYRCDCGTLFSRKDSFVTHRAFCDALMQEAAVPAVDSASNGSDEKADLNLWINRPAAEAAACMSATALLQKAAEMGAMTSSSSSAFFSGLMRSMKGGSLEYGGEGMTRDFLGLGEEEGGGGGGSGGGGRNVEVMRRFASLNSGEDYMSTNATSSYNARG